MKTKSKWIVGMFLGLVVLVGIFGKKKSEITSSPSQIKVTRTETEAAVKTPQRKEFNTGETATVKNPGSGTMVMIATSEASYEEVQTAYNASDNHGYFELLTSGKAFAVKNGTEAKIIDRGFAKRRVRILSGDQTGKSGWVSDEWLD